MKQFFKFVFASCLGTILALVAVFLLMSGVIGSLASSSAPKVPQNSILHLELDKAIPELTDNFTAQSSATSPISFDQYETRVGLNDIKRLIKNAATDKSIKAILLQTENTAVNPTVALDIARSIVEFKESGKPVFAYGKYYTQSGYIIACTADSVYLNPNGLVDMRGYGMVTPYFKGMSEKFGIDFDVYHAGKYKSAIEPYYRSEVSPENRQQVHAFLKTYQDNFDQHVAHQRGITPSDVSNIMIEGLSNSSDDAIEHGLVDDTRYLEDLEDQLKSVLDVSELSKITLTQYHAARPKSTKSHKNKIAVIYAEGEVAFGGENKGTISMDVYNEIFDRLEKNNKVKGVVLRVNSPGGSAFTSDEFWKRVKDLKDAGKYIVASYGTYAASGGYYISAGADKIVSEPTTLTGSIGVFSMMPNFADFSKENLGINWDTIGIGKRAFIYSPFVKKSKSDNLLLQSETNRIYEEFKTVVSKGREMTMDEVQNVAQGRVWSGADALTVGLVDTLGSLGDAINMVAEHVGYDDYKVLEYPIIKKTPFEEFAASLAESSNAALPVSDLQSAMLKDVLQSINLIEQSCKEPQARMPYTIVDDK